MSRKYIDKAKDIATRQIPIAFEGKTFLQAQELVDYLQRAGAALHTRYEHECNGDHWHNGEAYAQKYEQSTEQREKLLLGRACDFGFKVTTDVNEKRKGSFIRLQTDPRGWPVELIFNGSSVRLGGKP